MLKSQKNLQIDLCFPSRFGIIAINDAPATWMPNFMIMYEPLKRYLEKSTQSKSEAN